MWLPGRHCRMFSALASLLVVFVILKLVAAAVSRFFAWLGSGRMLEEAVDDPNEQYAQAIRTYVDQLRRWKREHTGIGAVAKGRPRLTRAQRHYIVDTAARARDAYLDYLRLGWYQVVIIFLLASMAGLVLEEVWMFATAGLTQSRPGLVWGPFSPLYGCGAVLLTLFCWGMRKARANDGVVFLVSAAVGGGLEQVTGWAMETLFHASSWTYIHLPDHITQWVAWRFLFFWGVIGLVWARYVMPDLLYRIGAPTFKRQAVFVLLLAAYLGVSNPHEAIAHLIRDLASRTAPSGIPTIVSPGMPPDRLISTETGRASMPRRLAVLTVTLSMVSTIRPMRMQRQGGEVERFSRQ